MFFVKLKNLYTALVALGAKFPESKIDAASLLTDVEAAILTKAWSLSGAYQLVADLEKLVSDASIEWTGSQAELDAFVASVKALLGK